MQLLIIYIPEGQIRYDRNWPPEKINRKVLTLL